MASEATPLYCSDVQSSASGIHITDLSQVITLQYHIIDNCTIMRIDTGQQLDIVYTTENLLIVTPVSAHTSVVIGKTDDEFPCLKYHNTTDGSQIGEVVGIMTLSSLIMMASGCVIVHLLFKDPRTLFGMLVIFYSLGIVSTSGIVITLYAIHHWIAVNSQIVCHTIMVLFIVALISNHAFATNILTHLAYIMYCCYNLRSEISNKKW